MTHKPTSDNAFTSLTSPRKGSLRRRLIVMSIVWLVLAVPLGGLALTFAFRDVVSDSFDERLTTTLLLLMGSVEAAPDGGVAVTRPLTDQRFQQIYSGWYWVIDDGEQRLHSRSAWDLPLEAEAASGGEGTARLRTTRDSLGHELRIAEQTVAIPGAKAGVTFAVAGDLSELRQQVRDFDRLLWASLTALAAAVVFAAFIQVTIGLRPLRRVALDIERVRAGRKESLEAVGVRELDALVAQVNTLIEQDRRLVERARANAADLAHSLKTPLALLRSSFEHGDERLEQVGAIQRSIERQLARAASAGPRQGVSTDVREVAESIGVGMRKLHAARAIGVAIDVGEDVRFAGDSEDLEEMLGNLLDNACKWACSRVRVTAMARDGAVSIEVDDDGRGMTEAEAAAASERGRRFDEGAEGSGLGLAIVSDLATLYGGKLELARSAWGGTQAKLVLPSVEGET